MSLTAVMTTGVETAGPDASAAKLAMLMDDRNVGSIVIVEADDPVGIVTDRDPAVRVLAVGADPSTTTARDVMSDHVQVLGDDMDVLDATAIMHRESVRRLPVVDDSGALVGIVALDDLLRLLAIEFGNLTGVVAQESRVY